VPSHSPKINSGLAQKEVGMTYSDYPKGPTGETPAEDAGFFTRWMWVYFSPRKAFSAILHRPAWVAPFILLVILTGVTSHIGAPMGREYMRQRIEESETMSEEAKEQALERMGGEESMIGKVARIGGSAVFAGVVLLALGGVLLFINNLILGASAGYARMLAASCYISLVWIPSWIVKMPIMLMQRTMQVAIGPAALLPPESEGSLTWALLSRLDLFGIWEVILACIALSAIGGYTAKRAAAAVVPMWVIYGVIVAVITWFGFSQLG
jgi:hypothetical protein